MRTDSPRETLGNDTGRHRFRVHILPDPSRRKIYQPNVSDRRRKLEHNKMAWPAAQSLAQHDRATGARRGLKMGTGCETANWLAEYSARWHWSFPSRDANAHQAPSMTTLDHGPAMYDCPEEGEGARLGIEICESSSPWMTTDLSLSSRSEKRRSFGGRLVMIEDMP